MPTNNRRRTIACLLRHINMTHDPNWSSVIACLGATSREKAVLALADLIEPEERTCERGIEMFSHAYPNEIVCDSDCVSTYVFPLTCGHEVELLENKWPSYCPHCGARVVADA